MGFVHDDEGVVEGAAAHEGERRYLNDVFFEHLVDALGLEQVVEGIVKRAEIRVDFFLQAAGEEAETFTGLDRGADEDDAGDLFRVHGGDGHGYCEISFAGASRAYTEDHVILFDGLDILALVERARLHGALDPRRTLLASISDRTQRGGWVGDDQAQHTVQLSVVRIDALAAERFEVLKDAPDSSHRFFRPLHVYGVGSQIDLYA